MGDVFVDGVLLGDRTVPGAVPAFDDRVVFAVRTFVVVIGDASSSDGPQRPRPSSTRSRWLFIVFAEVVVGCAVLFVKEKVGDCVVCC